MDYLLTFLYNLDVPSHNNSSEQAIRNIKVKMKVSGIFKSAKGAQNYAIFRSITDTCKKNQQDILNAFFTIATCYFVRQPASEWLLSEQYQAFDKKTKNI